MPSSIHEGPVGFMYNETRTKGNQITVLSAGLYHIRIPHNVRMCNLGIRPKQPSLFQRKSAANPQVMQALLYYPSLPVFPCPLPPISPEANPVGLLPFLSISAPLIKVPSE